MSVIVLVSLTISVLPHLSRLHLGEGRSGLVVARADRFPVGWRKGFSVAASRVGWNPMATGKFDIHATRAQGSLGKPMAETQANAEGPQDKDKAPDPRSGPPGPPQSEET